VFLVYVVLCLIVFGCQYQCNWLPEKTRLRNDLLCVEWDIKPYTLTHSLSSWWASCWRTVRKDTKKVTWLVGYWRKHRRQNVSPWVGYRAVPVLKV